MPNVHCPECGRFMKKVQDFSDKKSGKIHDITLYKCQNIGHDAELFVRVKCPYCGKINVWDKKVLGQCENCYSDIRISECKQCHEIFINSQFENCPYCQFDGTNHTK